MIIEIVYLTVYFLLIVVISLFYVEVLVEGKIPEFKLLVIKWVTTMLFILVNFVLIYKVTVVALFYIN